MPHRPLLTALLCMATPALTAEPAPPAHETTQPPGPDFLDLLNANMNLSGEELITSLPSREFPKKLDFDVTKADSFKAVNNALQLTSDEMKHLKRDGFAIVNHDQNYSFGSMYYAIYVRDLPVLVTSDSVLHAMHRSFDDILMELETQALAPTITAVLRDAHEALRTEAASQDPTPEYYRDVDVYLSVARNLLAGAGASAEPNADGGFPPDRWDGTLLVPSVLGQDERVLTRLHQVQALTMQTPDTGSSVFFGEVRKVDFTQFRPRGHYTKSTALKRYFRAMMWLGRADTGFEIAYPRQLAGSVLLSHLIASSGGEDDLGELDTLISWLVGSSDNLGSAELLDAMEAQSFDLAKLDDVEALKTLHGSLSGAQRIRSQLVVSDPSSSVKVPPPELFQLFGQRFIMDSFVLSKVVFDDIVYRDAKVLRMMPSGLDVAAALGNDEAVRLLGPEMQTYPYAANLQASRQWVDGQPEGVWSDTVYNTWLDTLRTLDEDVSQIPHMPQAMKTRAWQHKQLQTQLASWAELRHDTILYAKQSYTAWPGCEYPAGYVEPYPALYAGVARVAEATAEAVSAVKFDAPDNAAAVAQVQQRQAHFLQGMAKTVRRLEGLAEKELAAKPFSAADKAFLKKTIDQRGAGSGPPQYDGWYPGLFYGGGTRASEWGPEIADVHTNPKGGAVLEVATGNVEFMVAAIDNDGDTRIYVGPTYSYYEFEWPADDRLTDQKWGQILNGQEAPARPGWTASFLSEPEKRTFPR